MAIKSICIQIVNNTEDCCYLNLLCNGPTTVCFWQSYLLKLSSNFIFRNKSLRCMRQAATRHLHTATLTDEIWMPREMMLRYFHTLIDVMLLNHDQFSCDCKRAMDILHLKCNSSGDASSCPLQGLKQGRTRFNTYVGYEHRYRWPLCLGSK